MALLVTLEPQLLPRCVRHQNAEAEQLVEPIRATCVHLRMTSTPGPQTICKLRYAFVNDPQQAPEERLIGMIASRPSILIISGGKYASIRDHNGQVGVQCVLAELR